MAKHYEPEDIGQILAELMGGSARAVINVGSSLVEHALECLIRNNLREPATKSEEEWLFTDTGIFGTFHEKILGAYFMGLIGPMTRRELDLIRLMRNEVSHNMNPVSFEMPEIANRCRELYHLRDSLVAKERPEDYRQKFFATVAFVYGATQIKAQLETLSDEEKKGVSDMIAYMDR